jgi:hypothetical protein
MGRFTDFGQHLNGLSFFVPRSRSRAEWVQILDGYAGPSSNAEDDRVSRTARMVRDALTASNLLAGLSVRIIEQGSSVNNTNVRLKSDLDMVVLHECNPWHIPALGEQLSPLGMWSHGDPLPQQYRQYHSAVYKALEPAFRHSGIEVGRKSIKLKETDTTRVPCDVVPAFRAWRYLQQREWRPGYRQYHEGIVFFTDDGEMVTSFPEQHLENGRRKNVATNYRYKQVVRCLKKMKADFESTQTLLTWEEFPSSYIIESIAYNVPNSLLIGGDIYAALSNAVDWSVNALTNSTACNALVRANGIENLFPQWSMELLSEKKFGEPSEVATARKFLQRVASSVSV